MPTVDIYLGPVRGAIETPHNTHASAEKCLVPTSHPYAASSTSVRWSATSGAETEAKEMLPSPDLRMAGSGYIVLEAHGVEGRVVHAQGPRLRRKTRSKPVKLCIQQG